MPGQKLIGVSAGGAVLMAASRNGSLHRSTNIGTWTLVSGGAATGLPAGGIGELAEDPGNAGLTPTTTSCPSGIRLASG